jgi:hypothetical protein
MKNADLHVHSYYSDGDFPPSEVVRKAKRHGIRYLALADHNSIDGVAEAVKEGRKQGVVVIPAIEIKAEENEVLGYFIDYKDKNFRREIKKIQNNIARRVKKIIKKMNKKGIKITFSELLEEYRPNKNIIEIHLILSLGKRGFGKVRDLWPRYIKEGGEIYVPVKIPSVIDAIKLIKRHGGVPVLAHPWLGMTVLAPKNMEKYVKAGLKGIEISNGDKARMGRDKKTIALIRYYAKKYSLVITSGSDFHGPLLTRDSGTHILGKNNCDEKIVEKLEKLKGK